MTTPPAPLCNDPQETSIRVWWTPPAGLSGQILEIREFPKPWESARKETLPASATELVVEQLNPTATYEFRLLYNWPDGSTSGPGPSVSADTLAAGCTPKGEKKKKGKGNSKTNQQQGKVDVCVVQ